jgi:hypothetical protein
VHAVGDHAGLRAGERAGVDAERVDRHREQGHADPLAGGEQHVQLAAGRQRRHLLGQVTQLVGGVTHRGHHHDDLVREAPGGDDALRDPLDLLGVGDRGAAVLLHDEPHDSVHPLRRSGCPARPHYGRGSALSAEPPVREGSR